MEAERPARRRRLRHPEDTVSPEIEAKPLRQQEAEAGGFAGGSKNPYRAKRKASGTLRVRARALLLAVRDASSLSFLLARRQCLWAQADRCSRGDENASPEPILPCSPPNQL